MTLQPGTTVQKDLLWIPANHSMKQSELSAVIVLQLLIAEPGLPWTVLSSSDPGARVDNPIPTLLDLLPSLQGS